MSIDVHTLSGAYALDALTPDEAAEFERHLEGCAACSQEVLEFREVLAAMGEQSWAAAPRSLREEVLAGAERMPQQRPAARVDGAAVTDLATRRRRSPALLLAAAVAVIAAAIGGFVGLRGDDDSTRIAADPAVQAVFRAPDANQVALKTANGGTLHVAISSTREEMAVDVRDLPRLDGEHVYQLWAIHNGVTSSRAVLAEDTAGAAMAIPSEGTKLAITVEPGNGSEQPTTEPIATLDPTEI
jgi:anti-sigma-K factor RskA